MYTDMTHTLHTSLASLVWLLEAGGLIVAVLAMMSIVAGAIILLKLWQFRRCPGEQAILQSIMADLADAHTDALGDLQHRRSLAYHAARRYTVPLRDWLRPLEVIASLAPLLGLLGTVIGMIRAFQELEAGGSQVDVALLSGGIWQALITTAAGLSVAIPVVAALNYFERRSERLEYGLEDIIETSLVTARYPDAHGADELHANPAHAAVVTT